MSSENLTRSWLLAKRPSGALTEETFALATQPITDPGDGEFLVSLDYLSCDPTQRNWIAGDTYISAVGIGQTIPAGGAGTVTQSRNDAFPVGAKVVGSFGWQTHAISDGSGVMPVQILPEGVSMTDALGVFGITGCTAYFGITEILNITPEDTLVVSGAAGSTGSVASQLARARGADVIGIAGGERKCAWLRDVAGIEKTIDYKSENVEERLKVLAPDGVSAVFDNVGGAVLDAMLGNLALNARIALCGAISGYDRDVALPIYNFRELIVNRATARGFLIMDFLPRFPEAIEQLASATASGQVKHEVAIAEGFETAPSALIQLLSGGNLGKQLVRCT